MIPELGNFALIVALLLALIQSILPLAGAARNIPSWMAVARPAARAQSLFVAIAFGCLAYSFLTNDFSVINVTQHSYSKLPPVYRFTATWGSHEGSLLLWTLILGLWTFAVTMFSRHLPQDMVARVIGVMGLVSCGLLLFMLLTSNPFLRMPMALDGSDLNPLLQDPGMVVHPPILYMGYVGFSVAFAFALAALISGKLDASWARWSRPWTTAAWSFLTLGIMMGSWWAYYELGWGGWWFWDPTENASLMPWLVGTALIHSLAVTEKRGSFKAWTVLLAIAAFSLSLLGTFLVRSGVLSSVHSFASDPARGLFILAFLAVVIGGSLLLFAFRASQVGLGGRFALVSRESFLMANNILLLTACGSVLLGTLYPLFIDALGMGKISVGPPYFNSVFVPLVLPLLFLVGVGPLSRWKQASVPELASRLKWGFAASVVVALLLPFSMGAWKPMVSVGYLSALWIAFTVAIAVQGRLRSGAGWSANFYGMNLAHLGVAVTVIGVTMVSAYETERNVRMNVGDTVTMKGYTFLFKGAQDMDGPNYKAARGTLEVSRDGKPVTTLYPEKRTYVASGMPFTESAIDYGLTRDLYTAMGEPLDGGAWSVRLFHKPFVVWIWIGAVLMALGGVVAITDRRYRAAARKAGRAAA
ncbi:cytochrome c-type biogenesis protein CcmF [Sulfurimicrobium lacus]|uniref:Cytochrome c-type biogenesis protein CcmF n=1 Tax=Sulfurimicrobium lacus TaxID=2715678 RepID=A0A6F8VD99_9PROT|nr:heme lyase CcmF/NrfE family subunit [Sulfurimicrobium lacus]BCB27077.1 cytochrome c-type biogenesis protein CcmF [Sulfurimicrobium lacus]